MRTPALLVVLGFMSLKGLGQTPRLPDPPTPQQAYTQLLSVRRFAFGGPCYERGTSEGEIAYRSIAASTNALALFSAAFTNGNAQAKLYALCGMRQFAPGTFGSYAEALRLANPRVETMMSGILFSEFATNVVARISTGSYDIYLKSPGR